jgi:hypothetical protein
MQDFNPRHQVCENLHTCPARPLLCRGLANGGDEQALQPRQWVVAALLGKAGVDDIHDALQCDRRLSNVGGHNHLRTHGTVGSAEGLSGRMQGRLRQDAGQPGGHPAFDYQAQAQQHQHRHSQQRQHQQQPQQLHRLPQQK